MVTRLLALSLVLSGMFAHAGEFVELRYGECSATVATDGARVLSLRLDGREVLWRPAQWLFPGGKGSHGGIFICWPWFGSDGPKTHSRHGFARERDFAIREKTGNRLVLGLVADDRTRMIFPHDFDLAVEYLLTDRLVITLQTRNTGTAPFVFGGGFHPYFAVGDRDETVVTGLDGLVCRDGAGRVTTWRGDFRVTSSCDRLFAADGKMGLYEIVDKRLSRRMTLMARGADHVVVWNPGPDGNGIGKPGAIGPDGWRRFVCVEPVLAENGKVRLNPGDAHLMSAELGAAGLRADK